MWQGDSFLQESPVHCGTVIRLPALFSIDARSNNPPPGTTTKTSPAITKCIQGTKPAHREAPLGYKWGVLMGQASPKCLCAWSDVKPMFHLFVWDTGNSQASLLFLREDIDIFVCSHFLWVHWLQAQYFLFFWKQNYVFEISEYHGHRKCEFWASENLVLHCILNGIPQFK